ncbi:MAG: type I-E CRISPR-associated protein Cas7/Cse4/CasC [Clostridiales Family XIII bacterium]|jgi:CRISPR system Cascade subunit CasC|nr:type I-E CRISPR-associated protein Cas7/Cse4/CasC [Clostridiales Family XIII bacterium]
MNNLYIDMHVIQALPPSCLNRDDTGSPKSAMYGGVRRARVSSQSWKHAMRLMFKEHFDQSDLGIRTKRLVEYVAEEIKLLDSSKSDEQVTELAERIINAANVSTADGKAKALFFIGAQQAKNLAKLVVNTDFGEMDALEENEKKRKEKTLKDNAHAILVKDNAVDVALFGRMVADDPSLNSDASAQVAHAISTHRADTEFDYFTAADDRAPEDNAGAGMIGTIEFNSSTLYRYATVAAHELYGQLKENADATVKAIVEFVRAFAKSMPDGKMNTFANRTPTAAVYIAIRDDHPVNLVGAFEEPIKSENGYTAASIKRLGEYAQNVYKSFALKPEHGYVTALYDGLDEIGTRCDWDVLLENIATDVRGALQ